MDTDNRYRNVRIAASAAVDEAEPSPRIPNKPQYEKVVCFQFLHPSLEAFVDCHAFVGSLPTLLLPLEGEREHGLAGENPGWEGVLCVAKCNCAASKLHF